MSKKRAHKTLSLADKLQIIEALNRGQSGKLLAQKYGVGASTVCDIKKNAGKIKSFATNSDIKLLKKRKTLKPGEYAEFEQRLYGWFEGKRAQQQIISAEVLRQKAKSLHAKIYPNKHFKASDGWLQNFKKRFSLRNLKICGESLSARPDLVPEFQNKLYNIVETEDLWDEQIYNADESGLFWKMFPDKALVHRNEKSAPGTKMSKERITFLLCANKSGDHKLKVAVVGKSKKPRSFQNRNIIEYYSSKNAWMTTYIFTEWFFKSFIPQVKEFQIANNLPQKALLMIDNARCHGDKLISECGQYKTLFLPPNCTSLIQPMDQNAIRLTKLFYKKDLLCELVNSNFEKTDDFLKNFTLKDACELLKLSWTRVTTHNIRSCWRNLHTQKWTSADNIPLSELQQEWRNDHSTDCYDESEDIRTISNLFHSHNDADISIDEINDWINESINSISSSSEIDEENIDPLPNALKHVKNSEALAAFNTCIDWAKEKHIATENILVLKELRNKALEACSRKTQQTSIKNFVSLQNVN